MKHERLFEESVRLLEALIKTPSFSREEDGTAEIIATFLRDMGIRDIKITGNNISVFNRHFDATKPTILLCSHHDTVRPNAGYTVDPFEAKISNEGRLYGLGSNDAGASVVALTAAFRHYYDCENMRCNLCLAIVAEEEISGQGGIRSILSEIGPLAFAIVGEPTGMNLAIAEKGLLVLDCVVHGRSGHAARNEGENAIYNALPILEWFRDYRFAKVSELFGEVKMSATVISAGTQHNVIPANCTFTVDIRVTEQYTNEEVVEIVKRNVSCDVTPRSTKLRSSSIDPHHPIIEAGVELGLSTFGSPTTSDMVALDIPSVKIGPGESSRSHNADEYVMLSEIGQGIDIYIDLLGKVL